MVSVGISPLSFLILFIWVLSFSFLPSLVAQLVKNPASKESTYDAGDLGSISGLGRFPGEGKGYLLQYSGLEKSMDCIVHGVTKSWTRLSDFHFFLLGEPN